MDYRGTGSTLAPDDDLFTGLLARDAVTVLDAFGLDQTHLYGTSMGGRVAQMIAAQSPRRVLSTILATTSPGGPRGGTDSGGTP
ncbi:MAG: alpha/beta fold hydrolase [Janthinobacterium lividum]